LFLSRIPWDAWFYLFFSHDGKEPKDLGQKHRPPHSLSKWVTLKAGSAFVPKANAPCFLLRFACSRSLRPALRLSPLSSAFGRALLRFLAGAHAPCPVEGGVINVLNNCFSITLIVI
jgi:hypothetical protein